MPPALDRIADDRQSGGRACMERHTARCASFDRTGTASEASTGPKRSELPSDTNQQATGHVRVGAPFRGVRAPGHDQLDVPVTGAASGSVAWVWVRVWSQPVSCSAGRGLLMW
jgi:hypothetical protein